ncbi:ARM repeat-containing protein [Rozella allomycis CSF55]|uniref:ARM repeat-containing protein n=1 Tax=Rozella allomycis (strain CSF55) TaxID=988480 RepID=A0A4V1IZP5_ROZAC|nr:ARM repeat-containing protein [Rozella allomycis CSF55]
MSSDFSWEFSDWENALDISTEDLEDEIKGIDESKALKTQKTKEEIEKFLVDESLNDVDRALHLLKRGVNVQKLSILNSMEKLLEEYPQESIQRFFPEAIKHVYIEGPQFQLAFGKAIQELIKTNLVPKSFIQHSLFPCLKKIFQVDSEEWQDIMLSVYPYLGTDTLENEVRLLLICKMVLPEALIFGGIAQPVASRRWCCRAIGGLASLLPSKRIEDGFLKKAIALSQDTDHEVRSCMCAQMNSIARGIGLMGTKSDLIDDYMELLVDEYEDVRIAAITNFAELLEFLDQETKEDIVWPYWKQVIEENHSDTIEQVIAAKFGKYLWSFKDAEEMDLVMRKFMEYSKSEDESLRLSAVYNFPAVVAVAGLRYEENHLHEILQSFCDDESSGVKMTLASSIHDIAIILARQAPRYLTEAFLKLLDDNDIDVVISALANCYITFEKLKNEDEELPMEGFDNRDVLMRIITQELGRSQSSYHRMLYLEYVHVMQETFSRKYFKDNVMLDLLELHRDPVYNVRMKFLELADGSKKCLNGCTKDSPLVSRWNEALHRLSQDDDQQIRIKASHLLSIRIETISSTRSSIVSVNNENINLSDDEMKDMEKEEYEEKQRMNDMEQEDSHRKKEADDARSDFAKKLKDKWSGAKTSGTSNLKPLSKGGRSSKNNSQTKLTTITSSTTKLSSRNSLTSLNTANSYTTSSMTVPLSSKQSRGKSAGPSGHLQPLKEKTSKLKTSDEDLKSSDNTSRLVKSPSSSAVSSSNYVTGKAGHIKSSQLPSSKSEGSSSTSSTCKKPPKQHLPPIKKELNK